MILVLAVTFCASCLRQDEFREFDSCVESSAMRTEYGKPTLHLTVGKGLLWLAGLVGHGDREFSDLVSSVNSVRIVSYRLNGNPVPAMNAIRDATRKLEAQEWEPIVVVSGEDEQTRILVKLGEDAINGVVVMSMERGDEAVFITVAGEITPTLMSRLTREMDVYPNI